jgi:hypothetical protein
VADEPAHPTDAAQAQAQALVGVYEQLRTHALDGDGQGWRLGLALLVRQGLVAWIHAIDGLPAPQPAAPAVSAPVVSVDQPLVAVLASMALACVTGA